MKRLLLVERANLLQIRLEKLLERMGFTDVVIYSEGALSFEKFYHMNGSFSTVVIDVDQYKNDFDSMMDSINASNANGHITTIVLTERTDASTLTRYFSRGVDDVILKPFQDEAIVRKLALGTKEDDRKNVRSVNQRLKGGVTVLTWCSDYEIGVVEIDSEHKEIINHYEKLYELMKNGRGHEYYNELINFLEYYVVHHFNHEEALQKRVGYTDLENHIKLHHDFRTQIESLMSHFDESNVTNADLVKVNLFIKNWLSEHILTEDKKISRFISNQAMK